jgi:Uma2 family endonuclease
VLEYWIIEPATRAVSVLALESGGCTDVPPGDAGAAKSRVLPGLHLTLDDVFEDVDLVPAGGNAG